MLWKVNLSSRKLHSIRVNDLNLYSNLRRNPRSPILPISQDVITGDNSIEKMKQIEIKIFGKLLF